MAIEVGHYIRPELLPQEERDNALHLGDRIQEWPSYVRSFEHALILIEHADVQEAALFNERQKLVAAFGKGEMDVDDFRAKERPLRDSMALYFGWGSMALRDAALSIYHFGHVLDQVVKAVRTSPTILSHVDTSKLNAAQPLFEKYFPKATRMRNAVGHAAELGRTPVERGKNLITTGFQAPGISIPAGATLILKGLRIGRTMTMTFKDDAVSVTLAQPNLDQLKEIHETVLGALEPYAIATREAILNGQPTLDRRRPRTTT